MTDLIVMMEPKFTPIADDPNGPASLTARTYERLRQDILSGALVPGQKLKIENLRQSYGSGASPIREALSLLTSDGLVDRIDNRGFHVSQVSGKEFKELLKTRCWLEELALRESIDRGGKAWEEGIVLAAYHLSRTNRSAADDHFVSNRTYESYHKRFHMALIGACGSHILLRFCAQLYDQNIRYRNLSGLTAYSKRNLNQEHDDIVQATLDRDGDTAVVRLAAHYHLTGKFLRLGISR